MKKISILLSPINSDTLNYKSLNINGFQFYLVQLIEESSRLYCCNRREFQFYLVQLIAVGLPVASSLLCEFQFYLVQLIDIG